MNEQINSRLPIDPDQAVRERMDANNYDKNSPEAKRARRIIKGALGVVAAGSILLGSQVYSATQKEVDRTCTTTNVGSDGSAINAVNEAVEAIDKQMEEPSNLAYKPEIVYESQRALNELEEETGDKTLHGGEKLDVCVIETAIGKQHVVSAEFINTDTN